MRKTLFIFSLLFLTFLSCEKATLTEPFDYDRDTPEWMKAKIDSMSGNPDYFGTRVYRYEWKGDFIYHISIPISSCAYCELYDENGNKIQLSDDEFSDFQIAIKNAIIVWEWKEE